MVLVVVLGCNSMLAVRDTVCLLTRCHLVATQETLLLKLAPLIQNEQSTES